MKTRHNYDAVNAAVLLQQHNAVEELRRHQASRWFLYSDTAIKFGCAAAIVAIALALAYWLYSETNNRKIARASSTYTTDESVATGDRIGEVIRNAPTETRSGAEIVTEFTIFHNVENNDGSQVVTGWKYKPEDITTPYYKYCYWTTSVDDGAKAQTVSLGNSNEGGELEWKDVESKYKKYRRDCEFGNPVSAIAATPVVETPITEAPTTELPSVVVDTTNSAPAVFDKVWQSIVFIENSKDGIGSGYGSGVIVARDKVATNCHVVDAPAIKVYPPDTRESTADKGIRSWIIHRDNSRDFCLLRVPGVGGRAALIRRFSDLKVGETAYAVGAPQGQELTISAGLISQLRTKDGRKIQTDASISPGSSGGGLFDVAGNLIGITTEFLFSKGENLEKGEKYENLNFAIPADLALDK